MSKLKIKPNVSAVTDTLRRATAHHQRGQLGEAEQLYRQVLTRQPKNFDALHLFGVLMHQRGMSLEALALIREALKANERSAAALSNQAIVLAALDRPDDAMVSYDRAIALKPDFAEALNSRGNLLIKLGRTSDALASYEQAVTADPRFIDAQVNSAIALRFLGRDTDAAGAYARALAIDPSRVEIWITLGNTFDRLHRHDDALRCWDHALTLKPGAPELLNNRGNALLDLNRPDDALASFDRALAIKPDYAEALVNRANALRDLNRSHDAIASCDAALVLNPDLAEAHWNKGLEQLLLGDFEQGFAEYEWRWKRASNAPRDFGVPQWRGEDVSGKSLAGKTILLHAEHGFGDTIQFVRYLPMLAARGARIVLEVPDSLMPLIGDIDGVIAMISRGQPHPPIDLHCPLMSLPLAFGTTLATIPATVPYLRAPAERVEAWRARLPASGKLRVGLVWSGKPTHRNDHNRSLAFERLAPLLVVPNIDFVSLQRDVRETDAAALQNAAAVLRPDLDQADFADTAAIIKTLDLVIAVDTAVAHLTGALAKPLWLLLPLCPDWRWLLDRTDSSWYPGARLFRQPRIGDWDTVIGRVAEGLASFAATRDTPVTYL